MAKKIAKTDSPSDLESKRQAQLAKYAKKQIVQEHTETVVKKALAVAEEHFKSLVSDSDVSNLTELQLKAAKMLAMGGDDDEICQSLSISLDELELWRTKSHFNLVTAQLTKNHGLALKSERQRENKKILNRVRDELIKKINEGDLGKESITSLMSFFDKLNTRMDTYDEEVKQEKQDITFVINNIIANRTGRKDVDSFLDEFPTLSPEQQVINVEAEEIEDMFTEDIKE